MRCQGVSSARPGRCCTGTHLEQGAGNGDALALAPRKQGAAVTHSGAVALGQLHDEIVGIGSPGCCLNVIVSAAPIAPVCNVVCNGACTVWRAVFGCQEVRSICRSGLLAGGGARKLNMQSANVAHHYVVNDVDLGMLARAFKSQVAQGLPLAASVSGRLSVEDRAVMQASATRHIGS